jgi:hypothetical protein
MSTQVVHCKQSKYDIYIGRPSKWGNPFFMGIDGTRDEVIQQYREYILSKPELLADVHHLRGKILACWCKPWPCHGDVLAELADGESLCEQ